MPRAGRGLMESPRAGPESQANHSWVWGLEQVSSLGLTSLVSKMGRVRSPICEVIVILVRALRTVPGTKVPTTGELYPPPPVLLLCWE